MEVPLLLGAINSSPPPGRRAFTSRLPSSWEEGLGVEEKDTVITYFLIGRPLLIHPTPNPSPHRGGDS